MSKKRVTVVLDEKDAEALREAAHKDRTTKSGFLRRLLAKYLEGEQEDEKTR